MNSRRGAFHSISFLKGLRAGVVLLYLSAVACGSAAVSTLTPPSLDAAAIFAKAAQRFESLESFSFRLTHEGGGTPITGGLEVEVAEGVVLNPDRAQINIEAVVGGGFVRVKAITIGDDVYLTNPFTGKFELLSTSDAPTGFFDPSGGVGAIMMDTKEASLIGQEEAEGTLTFHLTGTIDSSALQSITGSAIEGSPIQAHVWIGTEDFLVRRITLTGRITAAEKDGITRTIILFDFNKPVSIEPPE